MIEHATDIIGENNSQKDCAKILTPRTALCLVSGIERRSTQQQSYILSVENVLVSIEILLITETCVIIGW
jgi:hypothetical protein